MDNSFKIITRATYAEVAKEYAARDRKVIPETYEAEKARTGFSELLQPGSSILDLGCGAGRDAAYFSSNGFLVTGIDCSPEMLNHARIVAPKAHLLEMEMEALSFEPHSFDAVWANASLLHLIKADLPNVLQKVHTILKPDGWMFIKVKQGAGERIVDEERFGKIVRRFFAFYSQEELAHTVSSAGFTIHSQNERTGGKWLDLIAEKLTD